MQFGKNLIAALLFFTSLPLLAQQQQIDNFFCNALKMVVTDANNHFIEQTNRNRLYLMNTKGENRFEATIGLPGFFFGKIISMGLEGLYYESMVPNVQDSVSVNQILKSVDKHILYCIPSIERNPIPTDSLEYTYHYKDKDTITDIIIRLWGEYPSVDEDSFSSPGQVNIEIYGDNLRKFTPYKKDPKKADKELTAQFATIEKGLLDSIDLIKGEPTIDIYKNEIWKPKTRLKGAGSTYIQPLPETFLMPYGYFAELYAGPSKTDAEKTYKDWISKVKQNAFADKRFTEKNRQLLQWHFLPYDEMFDPDDYSNIVEQVGFSCPVTTKEPINRTPLFTYHLFLMKYAGDYIVALNISNRY